MAQITRTFLVAAMVLAVNVSANTPSESEPDRQFDFWVGEWQTEMANFPKWEKKTGRDVVRTRLNGHLIEEVFYKGDNGENFQRGYLFYLVREGKWQHTIYDQKWGAYVFEGGLQGDILVLESPDYETRPGKRRETFSNITADSFDYIWEASGDGGKTWQEQWRVSYRRSAD